MYVWRPQPNFPVTFSGWPGIASVPSSIIGGEANLLQVPSLYFPSIHICVHIMFTERPCLHPCILCYTLFSTGAKIFCFTWLYFQPSSILFFFSSYFLATHYPKYPPSFISSGKKGFPCLFPPKTSHQWCIFSTGRVITDSRKFKSATPLSL